MRKELEKKVLQKIFVLQYSVWKKCKKGACVLQRQIYKADIPNALLSTM